MKRMLEQSLDGWLKSPDRKPLVLRGVRQVGKTWLIREIARRHQKELLEFNFERDPSCKRYFDSNDPRRILDEISLALNREIDPEKVFLFLDEIQSAPELLAKLRWFYEEMPLLPVVATGSLLEFVLNDHRFSMPVGRIQYLHLEPMGFPEYLLAHGQDQLYDRLASWRLESEVSETLHRQAIALFNRYLMVGGMPAVVKSDAAGADARQCRDVQLNLLATYRNDFSKYARRINPAILDSVLFASAHSLGRKFVYAHAGEGIGQQQAKRALELLAQARIVHIVKYTSANGLPLDGEAKDSFRKVILADTGILHALLKTPAGSIFPAWESLSPLVRGQLTEQAVGQQLRHLDPMSGDGPGLYYWQREGGRPGEIDYLVQSGTSIVPVEIKSGSSGAMKSLHQFMFDKKLSYALRFDRNPPSESMITVKTTQSNPVTYRLLSLPVYLAGFLGPILVLRL